MLRGPQDVQDNVGDRQHPEQSLHMGGADSPDTKICRLCLMAAIIFAFGKEALMFI